MKRAYLPYILGSDKPIPNLFEEISPILMENNYQCTYFIKSGAIFSDSLANEISLGNSSSLQRAIQFRLKYPVTSLKEYDILHTGGRPGIHRNITKITNIRNKNLNHLHSLRIDVNPGLPSHDYRRQLIQMADKVTAVSKHTAKTANEIFGISPKVIYNGVNVQTFRPDHPASNIPIEKDTSMPNVLFVGTLEERKRPEDVIEVAKTLPNLEFTLIGDGPRLEDIRQKSDSLSNVRILGRVDKSKMPGMYSAADALLFPSLMEGCPNVVLEAMASGIPVIGYEATSMPELITNMETGYLAEPRNVEELSYSVEEVLSNKQKMGEAAREYVVNNHSFKQIADEYLSIYNGMLSDE